MTVEGNVIWCDECRCQLSMPMDREPEVRLGYSCWSRAYGQEFCLGMPSSH
jgi:hypothetical protein